MSPSHLNRREFIGKSGSLALSFLAAPLLFSQSNQASSGEFVFLEAEQFEDLGGWELDQQSMDQLGSSYLLAHGLGVPVRDAVTQVTFPSAGTYRVWVRTRDWVAPWKVSGAPGKFQLIVDGKPLGEVFGTKNEEWHWHDGGMISVGEKSTIALHDLTGFEGRCEALLFCKDRNFVPVNDIEALTKFRRNLLGLPEHPDDGGSFDLVVVGGGVAGACAAVSAARTGLKVALIQDRPVLGGNASSEVRVWPEGRTRQKPYNFIGEIVEEMLPKNRIPGSMNAQNGTFFDDERKMTVVRKESLITLMMEQRVQAVETESGKIVAVVAQNTRSARRTRVRGKLFSDCTGDGTVGFLAGADYEIHKGPNMGMSNLWNVLDTSNKEEVLKCECKDKDKLVTQFEQSSEAVAFPRCPWAIDLSDKPFPGRENKDKTKPPKTLGDWMWESGYERDQIKDVERVRDQNFRAMFGAWDALKNIDKLYPNHRIGWAAFIAGKRETRRLMGDIVLKSNDFLNGTAFPDPAFPCTWGIDLHVPNKNYQKGHEGDEFISEATVIGADSAKFHYKGPYWAPYRCLYSRNIANLFMAGRNISVTHDGLGPVRVMRTTGMMGEIVGKAASICVRQNTTPRGVYEKYLGQLQELMNRPGSSRK